MCYPIYYNNILNKVLHNSYKTGFDFALEERFVYVLTETIYTPQSFLCLLPVNSILKMLYEQHMGRDDSDSDIYRNESKFSQLITTARRGPHRQKQQLSSQQTCRPCIGLMLGHRLRRCPNIKPAHGKHGVFSRLSTHFLHFITVRCYLVIPSAYYNLRGRNYWVFKI